MFLRNSNFLVLLLNGESYSTCVLFIIDQEHTESLGNLVCRWYRHGSESESSVTELPLPVMNSQIPSLTANLCNLIAKDDALILIFGVLDYQDFSHLGTSMKVDVKISNNTGVNQEIQYSLADSPDFLIGGKKSGMVCILPLASMVLSYNLTPIRAGFLNLPKMKIYSPKLDLNFLPTESRQTFCLNQVL
jgi:hypothetical protein